MQNNPDNSSFSQIVCFYFRNSSRKAKVMTLRTPINSHHLIKEASLKFNIPQERIVLFYNGLRVDNYDGQLNLVQKSICHVIDMDKVNAVQLLVNFAPSWNMPPCKLAFIPETSIEQIVANQLVTRYQISLEKMFLVYAGKRLNYSKTWRQELVEDGSEITIMQHLDLRQTMFRETYLNASDMVNKIIPSIRYHSIVKDQNTNKQGKLTPINNQNNQSNIQYLNAPLQNNLNNTSFISGHLSAQSKKPSVSPQEQDHQKSDVKKYIARDVSANSDVQSRTKNPQPPSPLLKYHQDINPNKLILFLQSKNRFFPAQKAIHQQADKSGTVEDQIYGHNIILEQK